MNVTTKIKMDMSMPDFCLKVNAVQGDAYSRSISLVLFNRVLPWIIPEDVSLAVRYAKPDGTKGYYDTLPDGTPAWSSRDNVLIVHLAPQMLTVAGQVKAQIELIQGTHMLSTFAVTVEVEANPAAGVTTSEDYINWLQWIQEQSAEHAQLVQESAQFAGTASQAAGQFAENAAASANLANSAANQAVASAASAVAAQEETEAIAASVSVIVAGNEAYTKNESDARYGTAIIQTAVGMPVHVSDCAAAPLQNLKFFGKTTQNSIPAIDAPVPMENAGKGSFSVLVGLSETDENPQVLTISTPNGLPGVPVASGGNYTDNSGQQWICDEVDFKNGIYVQRVQTVSFDGSSDEGWVYDSGINRMYSPSLQGKIQLIAANSDVMSAICNCLPVKSLNNLFSERRSGIGMSPNGTVSMIWYNFTGMAAWKAYMGANPIVLQYALSTPISHTLEEMGLQAWTQFPPLYAHSASTTVSNDAGLGMEITYVADTGMYIENLIRKYHSQSA